MIGDLRVKVGPVSVDEAAPPLAPGAIAVGSVRGQGRHRVAAGRARPGAAAGQEADERRRLGPRRPARRDGAGVMTRAWPGKGKPHGGKGFQRSQRDRTGAPPGRDRAQQRPPRRPPRTPLDPARQAAFDVLRAVSERDAYANLVLPAMLAERGIRGRDAAFATELAYGSCRTLGLLDAVIAAAAGRPIDQIDPVLLDLLRLGTYQLLRTNVAQHAAVSTTVEQAGIEFDSVRAGFVNGVLRTIAGRDEAVLGGRAGPAVGDRPGRPPGVRARPPALDRPGVRRRARRRRGGARRRAGRRRRPPRRAPGGPARVC